MTHSLLAWVARTAFFIVMILQYISFASYPARYENQNGWYALLLLYIPSLILWFLVVCDGNFTWVFSVWGLYVWLACYALPFDLLGLLDKLGLLDLLVLLVLLCTLALPGLFE